MPLTPPSVKRVAGWCVALLTILLLAFSAATSAQQINYVAVPEITGSKLMAVQSCAQLDGTLISDATATTHAAIVAAVRRQKPSGDYYTYLGGSTGNSKACPALSEYTASIDCIWYWETGNYAASPLAFYQGNFRPANSHGAGLLNSGPVNSMPNYFAVIGGAQYYPGSKLGTELVMFSYSTASVSDSWADNAATGGFQYMTTTSKEKEKFYATCRVVVTTTTTTPTSTTTTSTTTTSTVAPVSSSTATSDSNGGNEPSNSPSGLPTPWPTTPPDWTFNSTEPNRAVEEAKSKGGMSVGAWVGIGVAIAAVLIIIIVLCCCRKRIAACCCAEKNLAQTEREVVPPSDDDDTDTKRSFAVPTGSFRSNGSVGPSNASSRRLRRSLSDANISTTTPDAIRSANATPGAPSAPASTASSPAAFSADSDYSATTPNFNAYQVPMAQAPLTPATPAPARPATAHNNYVNGSVVPAKTMQRKLSNLSDESSRSFRQSRTVSFVE